MTDFDKNMIFSPGLCGHSALGTLPKTNLKDAVFEIHIFKQKKNPKHQNPKMSILTPKLKTVSELDMILSQSTHLIYVNSFFRIQKNQILQKKHRKLVFARECRLKLPGFD